MRDAAALVLEILHPELAQLLAAERVIEEGGQNGPVPNAFEGFLVRRSKLGLRAW